jgi:hypothetical protein
MSEWWQAVSAVVIGGLLTTVGNIATQWWTSRDQRNQELKERKRQNLEEFHEKLIEISAALRLSGQSPNEQDLTRLLELRDQVERFGFGLNFASAKVGDDALTNATIGMIRKILAPGPDSSPEQFSSAYRQALAEDYHAVRLRLEELLKELQ